MRLVGVALARRATVGANAGAGSNGARARAASGKRPKQLVDRAVGGDVVEVADDERAAARARPAALAEGDDRVARERAQVLLGAEHGAPERVVAEAPRGR